MYINYIYYNIYKFFNRELNVILLHYVYCVNRGMIVPRNYRVTLINEPRNINVKLA